MTAVIKSFDGSSTTDAVVQIDALAPQTGDFTFRWQIGPKVFIAKYKP